MPIFEAIGEILRGLTVNENVNSQISEKEAEKEAEAIVMKYNKDIEKREKEVSTTYISLDEEKSSFVPQAQVNEILAGKTAEEVKEQKDEKNKTQQRQRG